MNVLIVTFSYNRPLYLKRVIENILKQDVSMIDCQVTVNIVVENDDEIFWMDSVFFDRMKYTINVKYLKNLNRSKARNLGVDVSNYDFLILIDGDVIIGNDFFYKLATKVYEGDVIIPYLYGYKIGLDNNEDSNYLLRDDKLSLNDFKDRIDYADLRDSNYDLCSDDLDRLKCPWINAWSTILVIKNGWFEKVNGFDEDYIKWGTEDLDFSYRMYCEGAKFCLDKELYGIHMPHVLSNNGRNPFSNRDLLYHKHESLYTELLTVCPGYKLEGILRNLEDAFWGIRHMNEFEIKKINDNIVSKKTGCIGIFGKDEIRKLNIDVFFIPSVQYAKMAKEWTDAEIKESALCNTMYNRKDFDILYIGDWINNLSDKGILSAIKKEASRIASTVIYL